MKLPLLLLLFLLASPVSASVSTVSVETNPVHGYGDGWRLFGGVGAGYGIVSGSEFSRAPKGGQYLLGINFGYQGVRWVSEAGLGWFYTSLSGLASDERRIGIRTRSGVADFSVRYRFGDRWQLGPIIAFAFGTDTTQAPSIGQAQGSFLAGARSAYEFTMGKTLVRFWQQLWTDVSIPERRIVVGMLGFQVGLPFHREPEITVSDKVSLSAAKAVTPMQEIKISLDAQQVFFSTNKARLKKTVQEALADVGRYLRANPENVSQVVISGHADRRGSFAYNLKLSQRRAQEVVSAIGAGSGSSSWLRLESHSYSNPIDSAYTPKAWAKNRRVELVFREVKNPDELMRKLEPLTRFQPVVD